ncbi:MAG: TVP38/TMEM64 family protein [Halioglobus sp.]|nr:TVP38/TMEM64 family protein [Halioglobus sp.]
MASTSDTYRTGGKRVLLGTALIIVIVLTFALAAPFLDLQYFESQRNIYQEFYSRNPVWVVLAYILLATVFISLALPVTGIAALLAGALFGFPVGLLGSSVASLLGATVVFLWSRYLFRDWLQNRFKTQFAVMNRGMAKEGSYYLFSARLLMILPFFAVNIVSGLTNLRLHTYMISTFLSQTIVVAVFVYAGSTLADLNSQSDILSATTFVSLALVGIAPLVLHRIISHLYKNNLGT